MKNLTKRTAVTLLAGVMAATVFTGCGEKTVLDGTKTVATVNGTEIPMGMLSLYARQQQAQTDAMYRNIMGQSMAMWSEPADDSGKTYGEQAVESVLEQLELMCILKEKAADYSVEVTEDDQKAIADAAASFMEANDEETIKALAVTEDQVKAFLELQTYNTRMNDAIRAEAEVNVADEDAQQSAFTYVSVSLSGEELTEEDIAKRKENAQAILDQVKADPTADMEEIAKGVDESYTALNGTFTTKASEEATDTYPEEVMEVLRSLKEGEVGAEVIETETSCYIVRLDKELDEEATASKKESMESVQRNEHYNTVTDEWKEAADIKVEEAVLKTLKITNNHSFTLKLADPTVETDATEEDATEEDAAEDAATEEDAAEADAETDAAAEDAADAETDATEEDTTEAE